MSDGPIPIGIRITQIVGITISAYLSGYIGSFTFISVPALAKLSPSTKTQQWATLYRIGASSAPFIAIIPALAFGYLALRVPKVPELFKYTSLDKTSIFYLYTAAAILTPAIAPWTILVMKPTNNRIFGKAEAYGRSSDDVQAKDDPELEGLLKRWMLLNAIRSLFPATAAVLGLWAVVS